MKPLASILIPVYNRQSLIRECVDSALAQTVRDIEIIIVDNASTDATWDICREYAARDSRVRIFRNDTNIGPVRNWQRCVAESTAPLAKVLFSDDTLHPRNLELTIPILADPTVGAVITAFTKDAGDFAADLPATPPEFIAGTEFVRRAVILEALRPNMSPISPGAALFRRETLLKNIMVDVPSPTWHDFSEHGGGVDLLTFLLTTAEYPTFALLDLPLAFFRAHSDSITASKRVPDLFNRYHQAKIWFLATHGYKELLERALAIAWVQNSLFYRRPLSLGKVRSRFCPDPQPRVRWSKRLGAMLQQRRRVWLAVRRNVAPRRAKASPDAARQEGLLT